MTKSKVIIIAEAGVNHNGNLVLAKRLIDKAAWAGADYIKFQTFIATALVTNNAAKADYQKKNTKGLTQMKMLRKLELGEEAHRILKNHAKLRKIKFLSTPFDDSSILLLKRQKIKIGKIPSGEITSLPYLEKMAASFESIILSTGMATMREIEEALKILYKNKIKKKQVTILHCTTEYPAVLEHVNLLAIASIQKKFGVAVGYSDHTSGIEVSVAAVALGATVIEKHLTLDKTLKGPDHKSSLEPAEFRNMVNMIRNIEKALGEPIKKPSVIELRNKIAARKSIVAATNIKKGELFSQINVSIKRPGNGLSPMKWYDVMGKKAKKDFVKDEQIML